MEQILGSDAFWAMVFFSMLWLFLSPWIITILWNSTIPRLMSFQKTNYWLSFRLLLLLYVLKTGPWIMNLSFGSA
jgi:hypothetical protein